MWLYCTASNQISHPASYRHSHVTQCWPCHTVLPVKCLYKIPLCQNKLIVHFCLFCCGIMNLLLSHKLFLRWSCSHHKNRDFYGFKDSNILNAEHWNTLLKLQHFSNLMVLLPLYHFSVFSFLLCCLPPTCQFLTTSILYQRIQSLVHTML